MLLLFAVFLQALLGHTDGVTCLTASSAYRIVVSGSRDRTCIIWDLNKLSFVTQLRGHRAPVSALCINELTVGCEARLSSELSVSERAVIERRLVSGVAGGHRVVRRHLHPRVEHQRQPHRQRQHLHGPQPADPVLLRVGDERVGHAERHRHRTLRRRRQGNQACLL